MSSDVVILLAPSAAPKLAYSSVIQASLAAVYVRRWVSIDWSCRPYLLGAPKTSLAMSLDRPIHRLPADPVDLERQN